MIAPPGRRAAWRYRQGQALVESCLVVFLVCLAFFGIFQISQLFAAQEVLDYAAGRGARAITVGFNRFMVEKTVRVGAIPNAGRMLTPDYQGGPAAAHALEIARIPLYLGADNGGQLRAILDYKYWESIRQDDSGVSLGDGTFRYSVDQSVCLTNVPFVRAFYNDDHVDMTGLAELDEHYTLYLEEAGW